MSVCARRPVRKVRQNRVRPYIEELESRRLMTVTSWPGLTNPLLEPVPLEVVSPGLMPDMGDLSTARSGAAVGSIGNGRYGGADVAWYTFSLSQAAHVHLTALSQHGSSFAPVLTLYDNATFDFNDPFNPGGYRELAQQAGSAGSNAALDETLAPGTYNIAVSGGGNLYFNPLLAGSGLAGTTGDFGLSVKATDIDQDALGPVLVSADPAPGSVLSSSPLAIRLEFSAPLDPNTIVPDQTVFLTYNPTGGFGDGNDQDVALGSASLSVLGNELILVPVTPLAPGFYRVSLAGNSQGGNPVIAGLDGNPLGATANHPDGQDLTYTFHVAGIEGHNPAAPANDSRAGATNIHVQGAGLVQITGVVGDDPTLPNPAADVDLYHFTISGPGRYALQAEVFAGRINSPLDPGVSLFWLNPADGQLHLIASNDNTLNSTQTAFGTYPLFTDAALTAGLVAGDYYIAVSGSGNVPQTESDLHNNGIFDPNISGSGQNGFTVGPYVLNLLATAQNTSPQVVSTSIYEGAVLQGPPGTFSVHFDQVVNLQQLAYTEFQQTSTGQIDAVYIVGSDGQKYYPRLLSYDSTTGWATFYLRDAVPPGAAALHLSGALGLTDLAGNPLQGNPLESHDPSGDYVVHFSVGGPARGTDGDPLNWQTQPNNNDGDHAQDLGILFLNELASRANGQPGVAIVRNFTSDPSTNDVCDVYQFQVLEAGRYLFSLSGVNLPNGMAPVLYDSGWNQVPTLARGNTQFTDLQPGTYYIYLGGWNSSDASSVQYTLRLSSAVSGENPTPLTSGPAPSLRLTLVTGQVPPPSNPGGNPGGNPGSNPGSGPITVPNVTITSPPSVITVVGFNPTPPATDMPFNIATVLSSGPVGGVQGVGLPSNPAQQLVRLPTSSTTDPGVIAQAAAQFSSLLALTQTGTVDDGILNFEANAAPRPSPGTARGGSAQGDLRPSLQPILDMLFRLGSWMFEEPLVLPGVEDATVVPEGDASGQATPASNRHGRDTRPALLGLAAAGGLFALQGWQSDRRLDREEDEHDERSKGSRV